MDHYISSLRNWRSLVILPESMSNVRPKRKCTESTTDDADLSPPDDPKFQVAATVSDCSSHSDHHDLDVNTDGIDD